jgi:addiction module RelE/StbE family toxin
MSYSDEYHPRVKSDLKKLDRTVVKDIHSFHLDRILGEPRRGEELHGDLQGVLAYHFKKNNVEYRVAYYIEETKKIVNILMIGKRENFYEILKRRLP